MENIRTSGRYLYAMIKDMLDFAQMETGDMELRITAFQLRDLLTGAISRFMARADSCGVFLSMEMEPEVDMELRSDPAKLKQVLHNLLSNSVKFSPNGGNVRVSARRVRSDQSNQSVPTDRSDNGI